MYAQYVTEGMVNYFYLKPKFAFFLFLIRVSDKYAHPTGRKIARICSYVLNRIDSLKCERELSGKKKNLCFNFKLLFFFLYGKLAIC